MPVGQEQDEEDDTFGRFLDNGRDDRRFAELPDGPGAAPTLSKGQVLRPWANGTFTRSNGHAANGEQATDGHLWVCKLGWWEDAPWDVRAYAAGHSTYPCDPTMQQLYDGAEFDAYHELGVCSMAAAIASWRLPAPTR